MEKIAVSGCGAVTAAGLIHALGAAAPRLATAVVAGCGKVTRARAERIPCQLGRPWLDVQWREAASL